MKSFSFALLVTVLAMLVPACNKQNNQAPILWEAYSPKGEHFSIMVPSKPVEQGDASDQDEVHYFYFQVNEKHSSFVVSSGKAVADPAGLDQFYDEVRNKTMAQYGTVLKEQPMTICGFPGREIQLVTDNGNGFAVTRYFVGDGRFYQMLAQVPREDQNSTNISIFLNSFTIVDRK